MSTFFYVVLFRPCDDPVKADLDDVSSAQNVLVSLYFMLLFPLVFTRKLGSNNA